MKSKIAGLVIAIAAISPACATEYTSVKALSAQTGLSERQVRMVVGCPPCYVEYLTSYDRSREKFVKAIGKVNYDRLMSGQPIKLSNGDEVQLRVAQVDER